MDLGHSFSPFTKAGCSSMTTTPFQLSYGENEGYTASLFNTENEDHSLIIDPGRGRQLATLYCESNAGIPPNRGPIVTASQFSHTPKFRFCTNNFIMKNKVENRGPFKSMKRKDLEYNPVMEIPRTSIYFGKIRSALPDGMYNGSSLDNMGPLPLPKRPRGAGSAPDPAPGGGGGGGDGGGGGGGMGPRYQTELLDEKDDDDATIVIPPPPPAPWVRHPVKPNRDDEEKEEIRSNRTKRSGWTAILDQLSSGSSSLTPSPGPGSSYDSDELKDNLISTKNRLRPTGKISDDGSYESKRSEPRPNLSIKDLMLERAREAMELAAEKARWTERKARALAASEARREAAKRPAENEEMLEDAKDGIEEDELEQILDDMDVDASGSSDDSGSPAPPGQKPVQEDDSDENSIPLYGDTPPAEALFDIKEEEGLIAGAAHIMGIDYDADQVIQDRTLIEFRHINRAVDQWLNHDNPSEMRRLRIRDDTRAYLAYHMYTALMNVIPSDNDMAAALHNHEHEPVIVRNLLRDWMGSADVADYRSSWGYMRAELDILRDQAHAFRQVHGVNSYPFRPDEASPDTLSPISLPGWDNGMDVKEDYEVGEDVEDVENVDDQLLARLQRLIDAPMPEPENPPPVNPRPINGRINRPIWDPAWDNADIYFPGPDNGVEVDPRPIERDQVAPLPPVGEMDLPDLMNIPEYVEYNAFVDDIQEMVNVGANGDWLNRAMDAAMNAGNLRDVLVDIGVNDGYPQIMREAGDFVWEALRVGPDGLHAPGYNADRWADLVREYDQHIDWGALRYIIGDQVFGPAARFHRLVQAVNSGPGPMRADVVRAIIVAASRRVGGVRVVLPDPDMRPEDRIRQYGPAGRAARFEDIYPHGRMQAVVDAERDNQQIVGAIEPGVEFNMINPNNVANVQPFVDIALDGAIALGGMLLNRIFGNDGAGNGAANPDQDPNNDPVQVMNRDGEIMGIADGVEARAEAVDVNVNAVAELAADNQVGRQRRPRRAAAVQADAGIRLAGRRERAPEDDYDEFRGPE